MVSYLLGNCTFGKLPLGQISLGSCHLGKYLASSQSLVFILICKIRTICDFFWDKHKHRVCSKFYLRLNRRSTTCLFIELKTLFDFHIFKSSFQIIICFKHGKRFSQGCIFLRIMILKIFENRKIAHEKASFSFLLFLDEKFIYFPLK